MWSISTSCRGRDLCRREPDQGAFPMGMQRQHPEPPSSEIDLNLFWEAMGPTAAPQSGGDLNWFPYYGDVRVGQEIDWVWNRCFECGLSWKFFLHSSSATLVVFSPDFEDYCNNHPELRQ